MNLRVRPRVNLCKKQTFDNSILMKYYKDFTKGKDKGNLFNVEQLETHFKKARQYKQNDT